MLVENDVLRLSSRDVALMLDSKEHSKLLRKIDNINETFNQAKIGSVDYWVESTYIDRKGETRREYLVSKLGCEMLAHKSTGDKGVLFTHRYMQRFKEMEQELIHKNRPSYQIEDSLERCQAWMQEEIQRREQLKLIAEQNKTLEIQAPKVDYFDKIVDRQLNSNIRDTAKELGVKQGEFVEFLLTKKFLYRDKQFRLLPYSRYLESGMDAKPYFAMKEFANDVRSGLQTLITPKGREYFLQRLKKEGMI